MNSINDFIDNREIAIVIWLGVFFIWAIFQKSVRESLGALIRTLAQKVIIISTLLMLTYTGAMIVFFSELSVFGISPY